MVLKKCHTLCQLEVVGEKAGLLVPPSWATVMHGELEEVTFTKSCCCPQHVSVLGLLCPNLQLVHINFWSLPWETLEEPRRLAELEKLQEKLACGGCRFPSRGDFDPGEL